MKQTFPIFDKRDGKEHASLQFKTIGEIMQLPWNAWKSRGCSGFADGEHEKELRALIRKANKQGEKIIAADLSNYGVSIAVAS